MVGILLIYFIGRYFYNLAERYKKSKWGFAILGVASYYAGTIVAVFAIGFLGILVFDQTEYWLEEHELIISLSSVPFGVLVVFLFYKGLERYWSRVSKDEGPDDSLDAGVV